jgi:hypothetical protein
VFEEGVEAVGQVVEVVAEVVGFQFPCDDFEDFA